MTISLIIQLVFRFEAEGVPALYFAPSSLLAAYVVNMKTALIVDLGESIQILPVYQGYVIREASSKHPLGGRELTKFLARQLTQRNHYYLNNKSDLDVVRMIKEKHCRVALDYENVRQTLLIKFLSL